MSGVYRKITSSLLALLGLTIFTLLSAGNGQTETEVPRPEPITIETSSIFTVSATVNGEEVPVALSEEGFYVIETNSFDVGISFFPDSITTFSAEEYEAWSETVSTLTSLGFLTSYYEDDTTGFALFVVNESQEPVRVVWDETSIVSTDGSASRVIHEGVRFLDMNRSQPPTIIPPGARIEDYIGPTNRISFSTNEWVEYPLIGNIEEGDAISAFLAIEVGGDDRNVNVKFEASSAFMASPDVEVGN